jgi:hypothetical protein
VERVRLWSSPFHERGDQRRSEGGVREECGRGRRQGLGPLYRCGAAAVAQGGRSPSAVAGGRNPAAVPHDGGNLAPPASAVECWRHP